MVTETPNLKLKKPAGTDLVDVSVLNGNMDILDTQVDGKLDKSGGTMTGILSVPALGNSGDSYLTGTVYTSTAFSGPWVQISSDNHAPNLTDYKYNGIIIRRKDGYLLYRTFDEMKADLGINGKADKSEIPDISGKLDKSGGAMTGYLSDKTALQVRNVMTATEKPADTVGQDGDICFVIKA